ncbi:Pyridoxine 5'-phosphate synthase [Planctomycetales bacterium 10988]|nr:Pyridoxine 5'-phosphate synthase [Planctomycetales bacterium 10988]
MLELGVNIDHVATLRQARRTYEPDPVTASLLAELAGADGITCHLREDRRHIQDRDLHLLKQMVQVKLNLECACESEVLEIACQTKPDQVTLVPEKREEVTTEGGLDVVGQWEKVASSVKKLQDAGIPVSLFLDPDSAQIEAGATMNVEAIELHTGVYALSKIGPDREKALAQLKVASAEIVDAGIRLHAGHGLNYQNVQAVAAIDQMVELNIGHAIVSRAVLVGFERAVREMKAAMLQKS